MERKFKNIWKKFEKKIVEYLEKKNLNKNLKKKNWKRKFEKGNLKRKFENGNLKMEISKKGNLKKGNLKTEIWTVSKFFGYLWI